jgi:hypothetical protein
MRAGDGQLVNSTPPQSPAQGAQNNFNLSTKPVKVAIEYDSLRRLTLAELPLYIYYICIPGQGSMTSVMLSYLA